MAEFKPKKSVQKQGLVLEQRTGVDPHEGKFDPDKLGLEDWGDGFHVEATPVLIERDDRGIITRTTPFTEAVEKGMVPGIDTDGIPTAPKRQRTMQPIFRQEQIVDLLAGYMMRYFSSFPPGALPFNPLYEGIPISEALTEDTIFDPKDKMGLVHVPAHEVHEWLRKIIGARAKIINAKTGKKGYAGSINDMVSFS